MISKDARPLTSRRCSSNGRRLAAIYPREARVDFQRALSGADFSLQTLACDLIEAGKLREIPVTEQEKKLFLNVNELSDLQSTEIRRAAVARAPWAVPLAKTCK
jgi:hypothetical protein